MKKKCAAALVLAAALAVQPMWAFASSSSSSSGSDGSGSITSSTTTNTSANSNTTVTVSSTGVKTTGATTSASPSGSTIGVAVDTVTTTGQQVTTNSKGQAVIGDTAVGFAPSVAATAGLPENVVSAINEINAGKPLTEAVQTLDLTGYNALTGTHAIITMDANTGAVKTGAVEVSLYVPNLVENLANVQVLFYDNATGQWQLIPALIRFSIHFFPPLFSSNPCSLSYPCRTGYTALSVMYPGLHFFNAFSSYKLRIMCQILEH